MKRRTILLFMLLAAAYFSGIAAQTECKNATVADLVFLVDGSSSIGPENFQEVRSFLRSIIRALDIGPDKVRIGLAQYSDEPHQEFLLKDHMDKASLLDAVDNFPYRTGGTETGKAIDFILAQYFTKEAGSRASQRVPQIAVVITDGDSTDDVIAPALRLRQHGVIVFGIGVGQINLQQLGSIANWPPDRFRFSIDSFQALQRLTEGLLQTVCVSVVDQGQALANKYADIVFLLDSSIGPTQFSIFRSELFKLINQLNVGASTYRIGMAQYSGQTTVEFLLSTYQTKQEIVAGAKRIRLRPQPNQPHNLTSALEYTNTHFFTKEAGGRAHQGFRQFLFIVSGKDSDDPVSVFRMANKIKSSGITVGAFSAGASMRELEIIASNGLAFDSISLSVLKDLIITEQQDTFIEDCRGAYVADIVFIVDESGSIGSDNFRLVRSFLRSIVSGLEVGLNRVRVGIVTYNDDPKVWVYLNTFNNKREILQFMDILPYRGGGTRTGDALSFTQKNIFVEDRGSRKDVKKVAVVITDGESQDDVSKAAITLRRAGVTIYAVGIENANENELRLMASYPSHRHVFTVANFNVLKPIRENLQRTLCYNIIREAITDSTTKTDIKQACIQKDEADIYFLMDDSGSIGNPDFEAMQNFITAFVHIFTIGPEHVRMGLVKYANSPSLQFDLQKHSSADELDRAVMGIRHDGGGTETGKALSSMKDHFVKAMASRTHKVPNYLVVITDGQSTDEVKASADELREQGIVIYAVGVKDANQDELEKIAGDQKRTFLVNNFDALESINKDVITDICSPDACKYTLGDVFFLTDSSESISSQDYQKMKDFIKSVISKSSIGQNEVHVGVMQFSTGYKLEFPLNRYYSKEEISKAIDGMQQMNEGTRTGRAITEVSKYFDATRGGRAELKQRLVVITDGEAKDDVIGPAAALRAKGVSIYAIGVVDANTTQLIEISGSSDMVFTERSFDGLKGLDNRMSLKLCDPDCTKRHKADIIFLVDGSSSISEIQFESMQTFMKTIVNQTSVGKDLTRFGLILYSNEAESKFSLNSYYSKREVLKAIEDVTPPKQNTHTGKALKYSLEFFNAEHGGRKQVKIPQILMVITDGAATDPENLEGPSNTLRDNGVTVFSIGVKEANSAELETIAGGDTSKVFYVDNFKALETLYKNISSVLCSSTKPVCKKDKADVVFLLDRSSSIDISDYPIMLNFTTELVNSFDISKELVHVGVAQFSDDPQSEFYLNKYYDKNDVITHIVNMKYTGGNTNIGKALKFTKDYFKASTGSRSGIAKNLVLITDGDSHDDVEDAADELKDMGIEVFCVGVGDVHDLQLLQITGTPERLFSVRKIRDLPKIKQDLVDEICDEPKLDCRIDIAMGFDISRTPRAPGEKLISGHTELQTFLPEIVNYISAVPSLCCVDPKLVQTKMSFHVVDQDGRLLYDTNFEVYNEEVLTKVMTLQLSQPTYFNTALLNSFREKFKDKSIARVKVLVIFSDGLDEDVWKLQEESKLLQQSGVSALLTVALKGTNPAQLQMLEFGRGFGYKEPLSISMQSVGSTILKQIDTVSNRECCNILCKCSGHEGAPGSRGHPGSKGSPGQKGHPGFMGEEGAAGERGHPGPSGSQGLQGCPGASGQKGYRGVSGSRGEDGEDGLEGVDGEQGTTGPDGARGERGHPGNPGIPGIRGEAGLEGQRGLRGDPGEPGADNTVRGAKGDPGNAGLPGEPGQNGKAGDGGDGGNQGPDGRRGSVGLKGTPGAPGAQGPPGSPGAAGPQGRRGGNGGRGPKGINGFSGPQGEPGQAGDPGPAGSRGTNGQKGQLGDPGVEGAPGPQGPRGMPGQDGRDGYGPTGPKGSKGDRGFPGYPGLQGEDGPQGTKGYPGRKGNLGRAGNSGGSGESGKAGDPGPPGHKGPRGPPGGRGMSECQLITYIRDNCACSLGRSECPAYPTELVFGLDMSEDMSPVAFERQRSALLALLEDVAITESNCPTGARVAVVGYSAYTKYLIRFQDYRHKKQLIQSVKSIALERTSNRRQLGATMRFVGQNIFKRTRAGVRMRKVGIFFSNGLSQDNSDIVTAMMEYRALNIVPVVISLRNAPAVNRALEVDDTGNAIFTVLGRDMAADLRKVKSCAICYDPCKRPDECGFIQEPVRPQEVDLDLVMVVDSSREMQADEFAGVQQLLGSVVEQLAVSKQPRRAGNQARVAVVQQSGFQATKVEFDLQTYQNQERMRKHLIQDMQQQRGSSHLGKTLDFTLREVLLKASQPRRKRVLLTVVGTQTAYKDQAKLHYISQKAKCEGVAMFVVTVGERYNRTQVEELASLPVQQHLIHVSRLRADEQGYTQRFFRVFLTTLSKEVNLYPPPSIRPTCSRLVDHDDVETFINGQGSAEDEFADEGMEQFQEQQGGDVVIEQLDAIEALSGVASQSSLTGAKLNDACLLSPDAGSCQNYTIMWFFNSNLSVCSRFWYGSCGGNDNRFKTKKDCERLCLTESP